LIEVYPGRTSETYLRRKIYVLPYYHVDNTNRLSEVLPPRAPHNFGISKNWYEENCQYARLRKVLLDWMQWPGPEGWDTADEGNTAE
jgi:hypothetical protein